MVGDDGCVNVNGILLEVGIDLVYRHRDGECLQIDQKENEV